MRAAAAASPVTVAETAWAKVNLLLSVGRPRPDGYHELVSVMQTVSVGDELTVTWGAGGGVTLRCPALTDRVEDNLAHRAAVKFFSYTGLENKGVQIVLNKHLPTQAGLGGGSADAAAVLRALRRLCAPELPWEALEDMAAALGSDVPFCVRGGTAEVTGRGETLRALPPLGECAFVLVKPASAMSTGAMYAQIDRLSLWEQGSAAAMERALASGEASAVCPLLHNTFERCLPPGGETDVIRSRLTALGAAGAMLSGSGSAVFGVFTRPESAHAALAILRRDYPAVLLGTPVGRTE
ncbi:MAG: 4-(cytidine 5'-diphospho)-2-C-methyl-D-erythritol kinase [Oscillospiraceae bacterium]|nr:4-(cytidine 5'-diphospho)-2-C-methyl-D-erythritol kinase [Oscillospiraceae bacterium]